MGLFAFVVMATALAIMTMRIGQWFGEQSSRGEITVSSTGASALATSSYQRMPMAMTIPFAIARAQQDVVARLRRNQMSSHVLPQHATHIRRSLTGLNGARGLIAGLAVAQALGSSH